MADGVKISALPQATDAGADDVLAGVQLGETKKFRLSTILAWLKAVLAPSDIGAVPDSRTVNSKTLEQDITLDAGDVGAYALPSGGIPASDLASAVQTSLGLADTAYQKPSGGIPAADLANGVIPSVPSAYASNPEMDGTASPGSSGAWARGDHVHPSDSAKADKAVIYTGTAITNAVAGLTYTAINQVTVPAGIYLITASAYNGSNVSGTLLLNLLNYETATSLASNRTSTENGGGNTICAIVELTAASTRIRVRASQTTGSSLSLSENMLTAVRIS